MIVVDDDAGVLMLTDILLTEAGIPARLFNNPLDALMWASDADPTCLIVDLKLPGIEGLDLVAAFCALRRHAVVVVSAFIDVNTTVEAMRLGVDNVLVKPVSSETLLAAVRRGRTLSTGLPREDTFVFTRRERQVAEGIVTGQTTKQIAQTLAISPRTVDFFRASLLRKTQSANTAQLVAALSRIGFN